MKGYRKPLVWVCVCRAKMTSQRVAWKSRTSLSLSGDSGLAGDDLDLVRFDRVLFKAECGVGQHKGPDIIQRAVVVQVGLKVWMWIWMTRTFSIWGVCVQLTVRETVSSVTITLKLARLRTRVLSASAIDVSNWVDKSNIIVRQHVLFYFVPQKAELHSRKETIRSFVCGRSLPGRALAWPAVGWCDQTGSARQESQSRPAQCYVITDIDTKKKAENRHKVSDQHPHLHSGRVANAHS